MLSQETFLPWIILSLGIHITALSFWPLPPSWESTKPGPIAVDLRYSTQSGGNNQANTTPGSSTPGPKTIMPPKTLQTPPKPTPSHTISQQQTLPAPIKKTVAHPKPQEKLPVKSAQEPILDHKQQPDKPMEAPPNHTASAVTDTTVENHYDAEITTIGTGSETTSLPQTSGTNAKSKGYGSEGNGNGHGAGGNGIIRATPLGYGDNPAMPYPYSARRRGWEGEVRLKVEVSASGRALRVHIEKSSGYGILDDTALQAVSEWRFRPSSINGLSRPDTVIVPVYFKLDTP